MEKVDSILDQLTSFEFKKHFVVYYVYLCSLTILDIKLIEHNAGVGAKIAKDLSKVQNKLGGTKSEKVKYMQMLFFV